MGLGVYSLRIALSHGRTVTRDGFCLLSRFEHAFSVDSLSDRQVTYTLGSELDGLPIYRLRLDQGLKSYIPPSRAAPQTSLRSVRPAQAPHLKFFPLTCGAGFSHCHVHQGENSRHPRLRRESLGFLPVQKTCAAVAWRCPLLAGSRGVLKSIERPTRLPRMASHGSCPALPPY